VLIFAVAFAGIVYFNRAAIKFFITPKITPALAADFSRLETLTPKDSWIWTWWDYGTAIQYYAGRGVFHDGQSQFSPKTYFVATTYSTSNPKIAYNVITGIANVGNYEITKLLREGKKAVEIRDMFFEGKFSKPLKHPVYWAFTGDEIGKFAWINYFGTWNFDEEKGIKAPIYDLGICIPQKGDVIQCQKAVMDLKKGEVILGKKAIPIALLAVRNLKKVEEKTYRRAGIIAELVEDKHKVLRAFVMGAQPFKSMFNQMYILRVYDPKYFELIYDDFPTMVLYRVKG
jgi:dolichyl-diphosphooligosaccharide--protein glycosyltransferase